MRCVVKINVIIDLEFLPVSQEVELAPWGSYLPSPSYQTDWYQVQWAWLRGGDADALSESVKIENVSYH